MFQIQSLLKNRSTPKTHHIVVFEDFYRERHQEWCLEKLANAKYYLWRSTWRWCKRCRIHKCSHVEKKDVLRVMKGSRTSKSPSIHFNSKGHKLQPQWISDLPLLQIGFHRWRSVWFYVQNRGSKIKINNALDVFWAHIKSENLLL